MEDFDDVKKTNQNQGQMKSNSKDQFEEFLRKQNVNTMIEIYGRGVIKKIGKNAKASAKTV